MSEIEPEQGVEITFYPYDMGLDNHKFSTDSTIRDIISTINKSSDGSDLAHDLGLDWQDILDNPDIYQIVNLETDDEFLNNDIFKSFKILTIDDIISSEICSYSKKDGIILHICKKSARNKFKFKISDTDNGPKDILEIELPHIILGYKGLVDAIVANFPHISPDNIKDIENKFINYAKYPNHAHVIYDEYYQRKDWYIDIDGCIYSDKKSRIRWCVKNMIYDKLAKHLNKCEYTEKIDDALEHYDFGLSIYKMFKSEKSDINDLIDKLTDKIVEITK